MMRSPHPATGRRRAPTVAARALYAASCLLVFLAAPPSEGTDVRYRSTTQVAAKSAYLVVAECMAVETRQVEKFGGNLFTFSDFRIEESIAGDLEPEFTLRLFGGQQGAVFIDAPMVPRFQPGERVVLLLGEKNTDGYPVVSIHGVFRIRDGGPDGSRGIVETPVTGLPLYNAKDGSLYAGRPHTLTVDDFVYSLKNHAQERSSSPASSRFEGRPTEHSSSQSPSRALSAVTVDRE